MGGGGVGGMGVRGNLKFEIENFKFIISPRLQLFFHE